MTIMIIVIITMMIIIILKCLASVVAWWNVVSQDFKLFIQTQRHIFSYNKAHIYRSNVTSCRLILWTFSYFLQSDTLDSLIERQKEAQKINLNCFQRQKIGKAHQWKVKIRLVLCWMAFQMTILGIYVKHLLCSNDSTHKYSVMYIGNDHPPLPWSIWVEMPATSLVMISIWNAADFGISSTYVCALECVQVAVSPCEAHLCRGRSIHPLQAC